MVADGEGGGEDAEDEEGLRGPLVLDVVCDGVLARVRGRVRRVRVRVGVRVRARARARAWAWARVRWRGVPG